MSSSPPKTYSEVNFRYAHQAELIFQSFGSSGPSVKASIDTEILSLAVESKDPSQCGGRQTRTHYLTSDHSTGRCMQGLTQSMLCNHQLIMNRTPVKNARLSVLKTGILY